jgi:hypothetical protein
LRLALFAVVLVVSGLLGAGLGAVVGPIDVDGGHDEPPATVVVPGGPAPDHSGHDGHGSGHDPDEPFQVPAIGPREGGS